MILWHIELRSFLARLAEQILTTDLGPSHKFLIRPYLLVLAVGSIWTWEGRVEVSIRGAGFVSARLRVLGDTWYQKIG